MMKTIDELLYEWLVENDVPSGVSRWDDGQWHYIDVNLYGAETFESFLTKRGISLQSSSMIEKIMKECLQAMKQLADCEDWAVPIIKGNAFDKIVKIVLCDER